MLRWIQKWFYFLLVLSIARAASAQTLLYRVTSGSNVARFVGTAEDSGAPKARLLTGRDPGLATDYLFHSPVDDLESPTRNCKDESRPILDGLTSRSGRAFHAACTMGSLIHRGSGYAPSTIRVLSEEDVARILRRIHWSPFLKRWLTAISESSQGELDFAEHSGLPSGDFFAIGSRIYNRYDAGNYLWGRAMRRLGFRYGSAQFGSSFQALVTTYTTDDPADQRAIYNGYMTEMRKTMPPVRTQGVRVSVSGGNAR